ALDDRLEQAWAPVSHLNAVCNNEALREAYNTGVALITEYNTEVSQDARLYQAYQQLAASDEYSRLSQAQRQAIDYALRDFRLGGVTLEGVDKERYGAIKKR